MSDLFVHDPMPVSRLAEGRGSSVQPPLDQSWDNLTKLRWHAGVVQVDSGVTAQIVTGSEAGTYGIAVGNSSTGGFDYHAAWDYLNGVEAGANESRRLSTDAGGPAGVASVR